jgi:hypothetical protein
MLNAFKDLVIALLLGAYGVMLWWYASYAVHRGVGDAAVGLILLIGTAAFLLVWNLAALTYPSGSAERRVFSATSLACIAVTVVLFGLYVYVHASRGLSEPWNLG